MQSDDQEDDRSCQCLSLISSTWCAKTFIDTRKPVLAVHVKRRPKLLVVVVAVRPSYFCLTPDNTSEGARGVAGAFSLCICFIKLSSNAPSAQVPKNQKNQKHKNPEALKHKSPKTIGSRLHQFEILTPSQDTTEDKVK